MPVLSLSKSRSAASGTSPASSSKSTSPALQPTKDTQASKPTSLNLSRTTSRDKDRRDFEAFEAQYGGVFRKANHIGSVVDDWPMYSSQPEDYVLGQIIGFGASSVVYQAEFLPLNGRACAVKVIDLEAFGRDTEELRRETQLMSLSKHPNVLRVRGCWVIGSKLHIATRLMSSGSMLDIMRFSHIDGFPEDVICAVLQQALQGLAYLHVNGWLHRDLKAGNVLVDEDGTVLLGDFGVGVWVGEGREVGKRKSFVGTPCWMAPEVVERKHYNAKADIWSFGITALELAQGHAPYARLPPVKVLMKTLSDEPPTLDRTGGRHKYSKVFEDFVRVCLQKDPTKRPSAERLLKHAFFKNAKPPKYLVGAILSDLPPLAERQAKQRAMSIASTRYQQSWDFGASPSASLRIATSASNNGGGGSNGMASLFANGTQPHSPSPSTPLSPSGSGFLQRGGERDPFAGFSGAIAGALNSPGPSSPWGSMRWKGSLGKADDARHRLHNRTRSSSQFSSTDNKDQQTPAEPEWLSRFEGGGGIVSLDGEHAIAVAEDEEGEEQGEERANGSAVVGDVAHAAQGAEAEGGNVSEEGQTPAQDQEPLRIAMVSDFFHPNVGGVEGHIYAISKSLIKRGHKVVVITHAYPPHRIGVRRLNPNLRVYYLPLQVIASQDTLPNFFTSHPLMRFIFIREQIQLVHTHQALSSMAHEAMFHARWLGLKTIFTDHSLFSLDEDVASVLTNKLLRFVLTDVDAVVAVSYTGKENTCERGGVDPGKVWVIPNAVDAEQFLPRDRKVDRTRREQAVSISRDTTASDGLLPQRRTTIVVLSRLMYRKGIDLLVDAIPLICHAHPQVDFLIGGDGPKRIDLEQMRERHLLLDRVHLVGAVRQGDVQRHLTQGSIFLSTSLTEAFGTSLIEAASCGLLVVATDVGGVPEVLPLEEMMLLCEPCTEDIVRAVGDAIARVVEGHDPNAFHERVKDMYNWDAVVDRLSVVYQHTMQLQEERSLMDRMIRYHDHNGPVAGKVFCIVVAVDFVFWWILSWVWPDDDIDKWEEDGVED